MPEAQLADVSIHYRLDGPIEAPVLVLSNSLGTALEMWNPQMDVFSEHFRVLRYDTRGHGRSSVVPGPYTISSLGHDVVGLLDSLQIEKAHFCGLSMGGMTGIWLGIHAADRLDRLVLCDTAAKLGTSDVWNERINKVQKDGMNALVADVMRRWFTEDFMVRDPASCTAIRAMLNTTSPVGYAACCAAIRDMDLSADLTAIQSLTLVVGATHDPVTPISVMRELAGSIPQSEYVMLNAAHLSNVEASDAFTANVSEFLRGIRS